MHLAFHDLLPCRVEQAVYGSFPFWSRGYGILAHSAGCRPEWLTAFKSACQRFGERPSGASESEALFAQPLGNGQWIIVGVYPRGSDDLGRPGTMVFHALFTPSWHYHLSGSSPFLYAPALRGDWQSADIDQVLPNVDQLSRPASRTNLLPEPHIVCNIVDNLIKKQRVLVLSRLPIPTLANAVWNQLPMRTKRRASVATYAYDTTNRFQLVAMPRINTAAARDFGLIVELDAHRPTSTHDAPPAKAAVAQ
jgi:hypothetical protein